MTLRGILKLVYNISSPELSLWIILSLGVAIIILLVVIIAGYLCYRRYVLVYAAVVVH